MALGYSTRASALQDLVDDESNSRNSSDTLRSNEILPSYSYCCKLRGTGDLSFGEVNRSPSLLRLLAYSRLPILNIAVLPCSRGPRKPSCMVRDA